MDPDQMPAPSDEFEEGDLLVDLDHRDLVRRWFEGHQITVEPAAEDHVLRLGLLRLRRLERPLANVEFDRAVAALRAHFAGRYHGWSPVVGKNRTLRGIVGYPQSQPMGDGLPHVAAETDYRVVDGAAGKGIRVAVLDTGLSAHPALAGAVSTTSEPVPPPDPATPPPIWSGHGTFVAGLIHAQAPGAEIVVERVLGDASGRATAWATATAMARLASADPEDPTDPAKPGRIDVLNLSLGCVPQDGRPPLAVQRAVEVLAGRMLVVAAVGNTGEDRRPVYPAALPGVIAVGAWWQQQQLAPITPRVPWTDRFAPGVDVVSTYLQGGLDRLTGQRFAGYAVWSGTSFAAATVSGVLAAGLAAGGTDPEVILDAAFPLVLSRERVGLAHD